MATDVLERPQTDNDVLLKEIRDNFQYGTDEWREIREEGKQDIRAISGNPWPQKDRDARVDAGRPCLSLDELGQYVNEVINDIRQHKRAIKVSPVGFGANDKKAELRANRIRQIEYRSNAQQAYTTMFENTVQRSYGFLRVKPRWIVEPFEQELLIEPIQNPDLVTMDPDAQKPDGADMKWCFVHERWLRRDFKRKFPTARVVDFNPELASDPQSKAWGDDTHVTVAEYWRFEHTKEERFLVDPGDGTEAKPFWADELPKDARIVARGQADRARVVQYLTNGFEILGEKTVWKGQHIPIVCCLGKVLYVDDGGGVRRRILSLIRLARDPAMLYNYYRTCEAELVGMTPKTPFIGYVGQFRSRADDWAKVNAQPLAYLEADPTTEKTGANVLPLPQRQPYDPPIQALEIGAESARRAIQAAIGHSPLPTMAQRRNEKSGVALKEIQQQGQRGSFHFVDHYEDSITRTGCILDDLLKHYDDTKKQVTVRKPDGEPEVRTINDPADPDSMIGEGHYDVTIGTGPNFASEREAGSEFADQIVAQPALAQVIGPQKYAELLSLAVKLKAMGPIGDHIANVINPKAEMDPQQAAQQLQQAQTMVQQLTEALNQAQKDLDTKKVEQDAKVEIERIKAEMQVQLQEMKNAGAIAVAEVNAAAKTQVVTRQAEVEAQALGVEHAQQSTEAELSRQHESAEAEAARLAAAQEADAGRQHEAVMGERQHIQALEQGEQSGAQTLEQQAQAAALAPKPEAE